ncbi:MAG: polyprenyl synthetase family protein [Devosia sp.]|uniref:polyprenyl synthetase family protein n=1 Tax=Devosia sp. TaxID=1871048 RepID=UPI001AD1BB33|nr:farnesyl diphosphate synthase [Devosia sp.]MBN9315164.1 polyprenyl synthetase family protein [Devosia sp.]
MTYSFSQDLASNAADIERALDALLTGPALAGPGVPAERLVAAMRHGSLNGGKRLRPLLVRQAAGVFGVPAAAAVTAGLAVELVHCYSLVHDDLPAMDDDDLRRGQPTVHKAYDDATAILAGDALLTHAFAVLASEAAHPDPAIRIRLVGELAAGAGAGGMAGGQMRDIEGEAGFLTERAIAELQAMKTGALIRAAVRMGAILGGASAEQLALLTSYAEAAGRAFQLADDILDVTATPATLGKATGKDAHAGKQTIVSRIGVAAARRELAEMIHDALSALLPFDQRADGLRETARFFAERQH